MTIWEEPQDRPVGDFSGPLLGTDADLAGLGRLTASQAVFSNALLNLTLVNQDVPGTTINVNPGLYLCLAEFDVVVSGVSAGNLVVCQIVPIGAVSNTAPSLALADMRAVHEDTYETFSLIRFTAAGTIKLTGRMTGGAGTAAFQNGNGCTALTVVRIGS